MKFKEAKAKLKRIASGSHHAIEFGMTIYSTGRETTECRAYIDGYNWYKGPTWEDVFRSLEIAINEPVEEMPDV